MEIDIKGAPIYGYIHVGEVSYVVFLALIAVVAAGCYIAWIIKTHGLKDKWLHLGESQFPTRNAMIMTTVLAILAVALVGLVTDWFRVRTIDLGDIPVTSTVVVTWGVMAVLTAVCFILTRNLKVDNVSKRQAIAEYIVEYAENFVRENMGVRDMKFVPLVSAIFALSIFGSLSSLLALYPPTADLNTELAWAFVVFVIITYRKISSSGMPGYVRSFTQTTSVAEMPNTGMKVFAVVLNTVFTPLNIMSEIFTPISMSFRHFGNIVSGVVINGLIYAALAVATAWLPGILGKIPFLEVGIPAVASLYFDWFTSFMQAFIFCMLTMMNISQARE